MATTTKRSGDGATTEAAAARKAGRSSSRAPSDPVVLDGALVSDGESLRVITQIFETLVALKPGTTEPEPGLAESWEANDDGTVWTFKIRAGRQVPRRRRRSTPRRSAPTSTAGTTSRARSQNPGATLLLAGRVRRLRDVRRGQRRPGGQPLQELRGDRRVDRRADADEAVGDVHPGALAAVVLDREPEGADRSYNADEGTVDADGVFTPTGTFGTEHPIGTGPFKFDSWTRNDRLDARAATTTTGATRRKLDELIFRPIADNAARLQALQTGEIQGYDLVEPQDIATIEGDANLQIIDRPAFNVAYVGFNIAKKPTDDIKVRQAIAYGLDRQAVVDNFYSGRGVRGDAVHAAGGRRLRGRRHGVHLRPGEGEADPDGRRLHAAGPARVLVPDGRLASVHAGSEAELRGVRREPEQVGLQGDAEERSVEPGLPRPRRRRATPATLHLLGWTGDYGDADNFIGTFFQTPQKAWGTTTTPLPRSRSS